MADLVSGSVFAGHLIEGVAGRGGMGIVYRAKHLQLGTTRALKLMAPQLSHDPIFRTRFLRESEAAASITHPHVLAVHDAGEEEGLLYISMQFVAGSDLRGALVGDGLRPERVALLTTQLGDALDAAHRVGVVHRDVKPANVLLAMGDHTYLTDFGLAKRAVSTGRPTRSGQLLGTIDYLAPEQIQGGRVDARTDVYALGALLYQLLSGDVPFPLESDAAKLWAHMSKRPPPLSAQEGLPSELDAVVDRAMAKDPGERFASAGDLARAAVAALGGTTASERGAVGSGSAAPLNTPAETVTDGTPTAATRPLRPSRDESRPTLTKRRRLRRLRRRSLLWAILSAALLAVAGAAVAVTAALDAEPTVAATTRVGDAPAALGFGRDSAWVVSMKAGTLQPIDPRAPRTGRPIPVGRRPVGVAVDRSGIWVADQGTGSVVRVDPGTRRVVARVRTGRAPADVALGAESVWVVNSLDRSVARVDPRTNRLLARIPVGPGPTDVAVGLGAVWVVNQNGHSVTRIDPRTGRPVGRPIMVPALPESIAVGHGAVWVAHVRSDSLSRIDPRSNRVMGAALPVEERPDDVIVTEDTVWVANQDDGTVSRLDPDSGRAQGPPLPVGQRPGSLTAGAGSVFVGNIEEDTVVRIRP